MQGHTGVWGGPADQLYPRGTAQPTCAISAQKEHARRSMMCRNTLLPEHGTASAEMIAAWGRKCAEAGRIDMPTARQLAQLADQERRELKSGAAAFLGVRSWSSRPVDTVELCAAAHPRQAGELGKRYPARLEDQCAQDWRLPEAARLWRHHLHLWGPGSAGCQAPVPDRRPGLGRGRRRRSGRALRVGRPWGWRERARDGTGLRYRFGHRIGPWRGARPWIRARFGSRGGSCEFADMIEVMILGYPMRRGSFVRWASQQPGCSLRRKSSGRQPMLSGPGPMRLPSGKRRAVLRALCRVCGCNGKCRMHGARRSGKPDGQPRRRFVFGWVNKALEPAHRRRRGPREWP